MTQYLSEKQPHNPPLHKKMIWESVATTLCGFPEVNWKCQLFFFTQSTKNSAKLYAHVDLPWRTFDPTQRLHKMSFWVFYSESLFSGLSTKNSTSAVVKYWHLTKGRWPNALFQLWPVIIMMCRWIGGNLSVIGLEYRGMFQADCPWNKIVQDVHLFGEYCGQIHFFNLSPCPYCGII